MNGQQYKREREALGLSQVRLAELLGVTRHTIARRESGKTAVAAEAALAIGSATVQAHRKPDPIMVELAAIHEAVHDAIERNAPSVDSVEPPGQQ